MTSLSATGPAIKFIKYLLAYPEMDVKVYTGANTPDFMISLEYARDGTVPVDVMRIEATSERGVLCIETVLSPALQFFQQKRVPQ